MTVGRSMRAHLRGIAAEYSDGPMEIVREPDDLRSVMMALPGLLDELEAAEASRDRLQEAAEMDHRGVLVEKVSAANATASATVQKLTNLLKEYGDHKWRCAISKYLRENRLPHDGSYPECDCGWSAIAKAGP